MPAHHQADPPVAQREQLRNRQPERVNLMVDRAMQRRMSEGISDGGEGVIFPRLLQRRTDVGKRRKDHAADVARDGYKALMAGEDKVISGLKNKAQVAMSNLMPDSANAENMYKQQKPKDQQ